jgi:hypothetical protein
MNKQPAQVAVSPFANSEKFLFAAGGVLARHQAEPSREIAPFARRRAIPDRGLSFTNNRSGQKVAMRQCVHIGDKGRRVVELRQLWFS